MTMWTSPEAINAEVEYRRENLTRLAALTGTRRQRRAKRRGQAVRADNATPTATAAREEHAAALGGEQSRADRARQHREATLPAQRTSGDRPATKQPA
jgi:hypothetical protein